MSGIKLCIEVKDLFGSVIYRVSIPLERRITFLGGDSGVGKTYFYNVISVIADSFGYAEVETCGYDLECIGFDDNLNSISKRRHSILVFDDSIQNESEDFIVRASELAVKNDLYLIIINRVCVYEAVRLKRIGSFPSFMYNVLSMGLGGDGVTRVVKPFEEGSVMYVKDMGGWF